MSSYFSVVQTVVRDKNEKIDQLYYFGYGNDQKKPTLINFDKYIKIFDVSYEDEVLINTSNH